MVYRDVDMKLIVESRIKDRLCFRKPTINQHKRAIVPAKPFIEPLTQLKEYQEFNSVEAIHTRAVAALSDQGLLPPLIEKKKRRVLSFQTTNIGIPEKIADKDSPDSEESTSDTTRDHESQLPIGSSIVEVFHPRITKYGVCEVSRTLDEAASYEGETDILKIIQVLRENPSVKFFYLTHALPKRSTKYHYYNLKVAPFEKLNRNNYFTLSLHGCTHLVTTDDIEHISLERFECEYKTFTNICQIPTFARFRLWKGFIRWRKVIRYTKMDQCRRHLRDNLYIANSSLRPALLNVREMCYRISDMGLCKLDKGKTYTLLEFLTNQVNQLNEVCTRLCEFRELVKEVVRSACRTALLEVGFMPDDYFFDANTNPMSMERNLYDIEELVEGCKLSAKRLQLEPISYDIDHPLVGQAMKVVHLGLRQIKNNRAKLERRTEKMKMQSQNFGTSYLSTGYDVEVFSEAPDKMTFTEMAAKRKYCQRLTCFIRLADYQIVSTLHTLTVNSVYTLLDCLCDHLKHTPPVSEISTYQIKVDTLTEAPNAVAHMKRTDNYRTSREFSGPKLPTPGSMMASESEVQSAPIPLFVLEFILEPSKMYIIPDELLFRDGILEIINKFQEQVFNIKNLVPDPYFDAFTRPIINNKFEEKTCGIGPQLQHMFAEDTGLKEIIENVKISLSRAFQAVAAYMNTFSEIHNFYQENETITVELIQQAQKG
ncbi:hypothetical protein EG68_10213 [Paragonimus skrjabini miyazakii]|uniref:Uncharacterized protein n=1 Tax=Paragonimus skrjabini miyazakii TaxID=59628 RepID=A0A8S9YSP1_9TREM|nr:hypothetical protein EG68_10213 [Paragonimus skrjabini miyazakii]